MRIAEEISRLRRGDGLHIFVEHWDWIPEFEVWTRFVGIEVCVAAGRGKAGEVFAIGPTRSISLALCLDLECEMPSREGEGDLDTL